MISYLSKVTLVLHVIRNCSSFRLFIPERSCLGGYHSWLSQVSYMQCSTRPCYGYACKYACHSTSFCACTKLFKSIILTSLCTKTHSFTSIYYIFQPRYPGAPPVRCPTTTSNRFPPPNSHPTPPLTSLTSTPPEHTSDQGPTTRTRLLQPYLISPAPN